MKIEIHPAWLVEAPDVLGALVRLTLAGKTAEDIRDSAHGVRAAAGLTQWHWDRHRARLQQLLGMIEEAAA